MPNPSKIVYKPTSQPVVLTFDFTEQFAEQGLFNFTNIKAKIGDEEYDFTSGRVVVNSATELEINISNLTDLAAGDYPLTVIGYTSKYSDGYVLAHQRAMQYMVITVVDIS